jgi:DNA polymerase III sliding clamp (beta) subunit (PCNA family)
MKSKVDAAAFAAAVKNVSGILKKSKVPQLAQVRVQFADDACRVSATDMTAWLSADISAGGDEFSFVFRNTKKLLRVLSHLKGELTVEPFGSENDPNVYLHTSEMAGEFPVLGDTVHEEIPRIVPKHRYAVNPETLRLRVESVSYATSIREGRPASAGVRFQDKRIWSVDGYRMAIHEDGALNVSAPFILPAAALKHLSVFKACEGELLVGKDYAAITADGLTLTCPLVERSDELQIETVLPKKYAETYQVSRRQYLDALRYLTDCTNTKEQIGVVFDGGRLIAHDRHGKYAAKVQIADGSSEVRYAFNLAYMKQALEHFKDMEYVQVNAISGFSPIVLRGGSVTAMVLPLRMRETDRAKAA